MIRKVVVIGGGVLGSQIAYQSAFKGFDVTVWLRSEASVERAKPKFKRLHGIYLNTLDQMNTPEGKSPFAFARGLWADAKTYTADTAAELKAKADAAYEHMIYETDLAKALADADLVIESMAEDPKQKIEFYEKAAPLMPAKTILVTNSSTMLPSTFAKYTGREPKYLALHFANSIWKNNTAEIMGHPGTDPEVYQQVVAFASAIGMVPLQLHKEQPGYILNSMLVPFLDAAEKLVAKEVADPATVDLTWQLGTGAPVGPFRILDIVGLTTAYNIVSMNPDAQVEGTDANKVMLMLKKYIDAGKLGVIAGEGFYKY